MTVEDVCREIERRRSEALTRRIYPYPRSNPVASDLGSCAREMTLAMTHWRDRSLPSPDLKARFERGVLIEDAVLAELSALGIHVRVERRPFEIKDKRGRVILRGRLDGFVEFERQQFPLEVKSMDPNVFRRIESAQDFARWPWAAKYPRQIQSYCYAENLEAGFFLLDDCLGHWKLIPIALDFEEMEVVLQRCETAVEHREAGTLPDFITDAGVCRRCWAAGRVCFPPGVSGPGLTILEDAELEAKLRRREELDAAATEYDALDKEVKAAVRGRDGLVVGDFLITGKELTVNYKAKAASVGTQWRTSIERLTPKADAVV